MSMDHPVFIFGAHKSGSSLIRGLLDGHPDLFVLPFEAHIFQYAGYWVDYSFRGSRPPILPINDIRAAYTQNVTHYNSITDDLSDANLVGRFDMDRFESEINRFSTGSFQELVEGYFRASYASLLKKEPPAQVRFVEKSVEQAEFAADLKKLFPGSKFIHILRNPYSNVVAFRRHIGRKKFPFLGRVIRSLYNSYYYLYQNCRLQEDYLVVCYEDLLSGPREIMEKVASFLEIPFTEELLAPTSLGEDWSGNSSRGIKYKSVSTKNLDLWKKDITNLEIFLVNRYFSFLLKDYHYDLLYPSRSPYWPEKNERPDTYIRNRLIKDFIK